MHKVINFIGKEKVLLLFLFILILLSRLYFLGSSLWHDDAFNFVDKALNLAVNSQYSNAHSTGYPFWIIILALAMKIGHFFTGEWSVIFLPNLTIAIFGSLLLFPIYTLSKKILNNTYYSLSIAVAVLINPIIWRWSEIAMSDIFALFFILYAIVFFIDFIEKDSYKYLWLSNLFLYTALMSRVLYGLVLLPFIIFWFILKKQFNFRRFIDVVISWFITVSVMIFTYGLFHNFNFLIIFSGYGSVLPNLKEFLLSSIIILKSVGPIMILISGLGLIYLFKENKKYFYFFLSFLVIFFCYLSTWYRNGSFDIERYSILITVILLIIAGYCLTINKITRVLFIISLIISLFIFIKGIDLPLNQYNTYVSVDKSFLNYAFKASQLKQQTKIDLDLQIYQDLADYIDNKDIVFHWSNDWIMPKLLLSGAHLPKKAILVSIESKEDLEDKLIKYKDKKIYLLRGAYDTYIEIIDNYKPVESIILNNQSVINFIPTD